MAGIIGALCCAVVPAGGAKSASAVTNDLGSHVSRHHGPVTFPVHIPVSNDRAQHERPDTGYEFVVHRFGPSVLEYFAHFDGVLSRSQIQFGGPARRARSSKGAPKKNDAQRREAQAPQAHNEHREGPLRHILLSAQIGLGPVSYTHLTLPTN